MTTPLDDLLTLSEAARKLPGGPRRETLWRWCVRGLLTADGERLYLPYRRLGRRVLVDPADIDEFSRQLAQADREHHRRQHVGHRVATRPARRVSRAVAAEREAQALGI